MPFVAHKNIAAIANVVKKIIPFITCSARLIARYFE
jgi:hypothetical protein